MNDQKDPAQKDLEDVFLWILEQEEIPLQTRRDFANHVMSVGGLDQKSVEFIQNYLDKVESLTQGNVAILEDQLAEFSAYLAREKDPKTSTKRDIADRAEAQMIRLSENFKADFKNFEAQKFGEAEDQEEEDNQAKIEALKKGL